MRKLVFRVMRLIALVGIVAAFPGCILAGYMFPNFPDYSGSWIGEVTNADGSEVRMEFGSEFRMEFTFTFDEEKSNTHFEYYAVSGFFGAAPLVPEASIIGVPNLHFFSDDIPDGGINWDKDLSPVYRVGFANFRMDDMEDPDRLTGKLRYDYYEDTWHSFILRRVPE